VIVSSVSLGLTKISQVIQLIFAISHSTAHVERSFSLMNIIKNKLRASLRQDMLNKSMVVALSQSSVDAEEVFFIGFDLVSKEVQLWFWAREGSQYFCFEKEIQR
jgi:hypothetical protein